MYNYELSKPGHFKKKRIVPEKGLFFPGKSNYNQGIIILLRLRLPTGRVPRGNLKMAYKAAINHTHKTGNMR